jgi:formate dehydrogenase major subunit
VSGRRLYDNGVMAQHSPTLRQLVGDASLRANPYDLDQVGVEPGERVRVTSPRGSLVVGTVHDSDIPRGTAVLEFNLPGDGAAGLIDAGQVVTEVRLESTRGNA